jgi:D-Tyr-tRNAtyr deacylase
LNYKYRKNIKPAEVTLESIRMALFSFFGIEEADNPEEIERKIEKVTGKRTVTNDEMQAWYKAGMPSPFNRWINNYRKSR